MSTALAVEPLLSLPKEIYNVNDEIQMNSPLERQPSCECILTPRAKNLQKQQNKLNTDEPWKYCKYGKLDELKKWCKNDKNKYQLKEGTLRGVFGENPLHVTVLYEQTHCAKWLINNYPNLIWQKYEYKLYLINNIDEENEETDNSVLNEYEGETVLHLLIAKDNYQLFDYILPSKVQQKIANNQDEKNKEDEDYHADEDMKSISELTKKLDKIQNLLSLGKIADDDYVVDEEEKKEKIKMKRYRNIENKNDKDGRPNLNEEDLMKLINQGQVTGNFFQRTVDYGTHALTFCVVLERKKMFERLLEYGGDINCTAKESGDTIFHYCAKLNLDEMFNFVVDACKRYGKNEKSLSDVIAVRNDKRYTSLQYAVKHKNIEIFEAILKFEETTIWKYGTIECVACPLKELDTFGDDNPNSVLEVIVADNALRFVELPVIEAILADKWKSYAKKYFYVWFLLHLIYSIALLLFYLFYHDEHSFIWVILILSGSKVVITEYLRISELLGLIKEHQISTGMDIFFQWNLADFSIIEFFHALLLFSNLFIICLWISLLIDDGDYIKVFMALSIISEVFYTLYFCLTSEQIGTLIISTLRIITGDVRRFFILFGVVAIGFAAAIVLLCDNKIRLNRAIIALFYILVGAGDYWIDDDDCTGCDELSSWQLAMNEIIYFLFLLISTVLLFNLLIAIFSDTLGEISKNSKENWQYLHASIILSIERKADIWCFRNRLYHRTGVSGQKYGFNKQLKKEHDHEHNKNKNHHDDLPHYIIFRRHLKTNQLEQQDNEQKGAFVKLFSSKSNRRKGKKNTPKDE